MITHDLVQGSPEWHAFRAEHFNASDAPAMMGVSLYKSRNELLREKSTGIAVDVDSSTQRRFDDGHRFEALARPLAGKIIGEELYPATGSEGKYAASFDGITILDDIIFEHKTLNADICAALGGDGNTGALHEHYRVQMEHQLMVSGASKCLFMATKWEGDTLDEECHGWYIADLVLRKRIVDGWDQFERDLANYQPVEITEKPKAEAIMELPALFVQVRGEVTSSNLREFKEAANTFIAAIKTELQTDSDFANAEATVKFCKNAEESLDAAKKATLAQTASIDELMRTVDHIQAQLREKRLMLDKLVKTEKDRRKAEMVIEANVKYADHVAGLQDEISGIRLSQLLKTPDFGGAIKGLKSLASMHDALDTALANGKIEANAVAKDVRAKLEWCKDEAMGMSFLFPDLQNFIGMDLEAFKAVIKNRIAEHKAAEAEKAAAAIAKIEEEAKAKAEREAAAKLAAEEARIRAEERAKAEAEQRAEAEARAKIESESKARVHAEIESRKAASSKVAQITGAKQPGEIVGEEIPRPHRDSMVAVIAEHYGISIEHAEEWLRAEFAEVAA